MKSTKDNVTNNYVYHPISLHLMSGFSLSDKPGYPMNRTTQKGSPATSPSNASTRPPNAKAIPHIIFLESSVTKKNGISSLNAVDHCLQNTESRPRRRKMYCSINGLKFGGVSGLWHVLYKMRQVFILKNYPALTSTDNKMIKQKLLKPETFQARKK